MGSWGLSGLRIAAAKAARDTRAAMGVKARILVVKGLLGVKVREAADVRGCWGNEGSKSDLLYV